MMIDGGWLLVAIICVPFSWSFFRERGRKEARKALIFFAKRSSSGSDYVVLWYRTVSSWDQVDLYYDHNLSLSIIETTCCGEAGNASM